MEQADIELKKQQYLYNAIFHDLINRITIDEIIEINRYLQHNLFLQHLQSKGINVYISIHLLYHIIRLHLFTINSCLLKCHCILSF